MWYYSIPRQHKKLSNQLYLCQKQMLSTSHPLSLMTLTGTLLNACRGSLTVRVSLPRSLQLRDYTRKQKFPYHIFTMNQSFIKWIIKYHSSFNISFCSISLFANSVQSVCKVKLQISCKRCKTFIKSCKITVENLSNYKQTYWQK